MRNPARINKVLRELGRLWSERPDWRLGQLIVNIADADPFFIEDYDLLIVGFEKFGKSELQREDFPNYWIQPDEFRRFIEVLKEKKK